MNTPVGEATGVQGLHIWNCWIISEWLICDDKSYKVDVVEILFVVVMQYRPFSEGEGIRGMRSKMNREQEVQECDATEIQSGNKS